MKWDKILHNMAPYWRCRVHLPREEKNTCIFCSFLEDSPDDSSLKQSAGFSHTLEEFTIGEAFSH